MSKNVYEIEAEQVIKIIDLAIESFSSAPPKDFDEDNIKHVIDVYLEYKRDTIYPLPQFKNTASLNYIKKDVLTYFQEASDSTVDYFWEKVKSNNLPIKRINSLAKIIKRGKIKNHIEYDTVIDLFPSLLESKSISDEEINKINNMISEFENKVNK
jgi:hypothetical protein